MDNFQIIIQGTCHKDILMAHVTESYVLDGISHACILDIRLPEYRICRNVGFSSCEVDAILSSVKENIGEITKKAETDEPLMFDELTEEMEPFREKILSGVD